MTAEDASTDTADNGSIAKGVLAESFDVI